MPFIYIIYILCADCSIHYIGYIYIHCWLLGRICRQMLLSMQKPFNYNRRANLANERQTFINPTQTFFILDTGNYSYRFHRRTFIRTMPDLLKTFTLEVKQFFIHFFNCMQHFLLHSGIICSL